MFGKIYLCYRKQILLTLQIIKTFVIQTGYIIFSLQQKGRRVYDAVIKLICLF